MLKQHFRINEACGVNIVVAGDGSLNISLCLIKANGNQVDLTKKVTGLKELKELQKHLPEKVPIALNVSGKGVLIKQTEHIDKINEQNFSKVVPNANPDDFYIQNYISGERSFIGLIRKADAERWIHDLELLGLKVLLFSLGPFSVSNILPQLNFYGEQILFDGHQIQRDAQGNWVSYRYEVNSSTEFSIKLETEIIDGSLVLAYAAAFQLILVDTLPIVQADISQLGVQLKKALTDKRISVISLVTLSVLFVLLLLNFITLTHYTAENEKLALRVGQTARNLTDFDLLNTSIEQKEAMLDSLGWDEIGNHSILIDQIAQLVPPELTWQEVFVNPLDLGTDQAQRSINFQKSTIKVVGSSQRIILVNEWIGRLKSLSWVKKVLLQTYNYNSEENTGQFTVLIDY
jgi:hypothetical protein